MTARLIALGDAAPVPWANGGGVTRPLLAEPDANRWRFRISVADIESDGPFSALPGVRRWFAVLRGGAIVLTVDGADRLCEPGGEATAFDGGATTSARRLGGSSRDLNLMLRGGRGAMQRARHEEPWQPRSPRWGLFALGAADCTIDGARTHVPANTLLWVDDEAASASARSTTEREPLVAWWLAVDVRAATGADA